LRVLHPPRFDTLVQLFCVLVQPSDLIGEFLLKLTTGQITGNKCLWSTQCSASGGTPQHSHTQEFRS
ncbi:hypothetical protein LEMLEM_LOCUS16012, partial [Lemmus lemmus]